MDEPRQQPARLRAAAATLIAVAALVGCQPAAVSLEEAKKITAGFAGQGFVPPPRTISDITAILDQQKPDPATAEANRTAADAAPPAGASDADLASFHHRRALAANELGRGKQWADDAREAVRLGRLANLEIDPFLQTLGQAELRMGNVKQGLEIQQERLKNIPDSSRGRYFNVYSMLATVNARMGDMEAANRWLGQNERLLGESANWRGNAALFRENWQAQVLQPRAAIAEASGKIADAEAAYRGALENVQRMIAKGPLPAGSGPPPGAHENWADGLTMDIARVLSRQNRLVEAEVEARRALLSQLKRRGRYAPETGGMILGLGNIIQQQGRYREAEQLGGAALDVFVNIGAGTGSFTIANARRLIARARGSQGRWGETLATYEEMRRDLAADPAAVEQFLGGDVNYAFALLRAGNAEAAIPIMQAAVTKSVRLVGDRHADTARARGFLGTALAATKQNERALAEFQAAIPILMSRSRQSEDEEGGSLQDQQTQRILESFIGLLADIKGTPLEARAGTDVAAEAFRLADAARGQSVQRALAASSARAAAKDPALADLVRREQDAQKQVASLYGLLSNILSSPPAQQDAAAIRTLRGQIDSLRGARASIREDIEKRFPDYVNLIDPRPATIAEARASLRPGEALVATYVGRDRGFVWAVPAEGDIAFAGVAMSERQVEAAVKDLRKALDPNVSTLGDIPEFDVALAHRLYAAFLKPVEAGWSTATSLLVVPHKALGQLPLALLVTAATTLGPESGALFSNYKNVPFLARKAAVTQLPSVASLASLRSLPAPKGERRAFIGFGDPWFSPEQAAAARAEAAQATQAAALRTPGAMTAMQTRGLPLKLRSAPSTQTVDSAELGMLPRLPDTADEVKGIALALKADPVADVILGAQANENTVKTMDLSNRRIVMFATHGLVPGDLNGLTQPALALSAPNVADVDGDGLLSLEEILALKLDADWVVLSACNTATGDGAGAEAVSGLGRAFFYAGTRALLVSNWPVETNSARLLTTDLFRRQAEDPALARAEALRQAMLGLIDGEGMIDPATNRTAFSFAHPIFWAPFSVVGDGGGGRPGS